MIFKYINMESYTRFAQFKYFRTLQYPYVGVTVNIDITDALRFSRECDKSFYLTVLHLVALAADGVPAFRQRIRGEQIIEYSENYPMATKNYYSQVVVIFNVAIVAMIAL